MKTLIASERLFPYIDSAYLDCITDNLALLLLHLGHCDVRTPFACQWHFAFNASGSEELPSLSRCSWAEIIQKQTEYRLRQKTLDSSNYVETLRAFLENGQPVLVFGDAFFMPWLPYFEYEHQEHSFLIDGITEDEQIFHVADAYNNTTEKGRAQPVTIEVPATALQVILNLKSEHAKTLLWLERTGEAPTLNVKEVLLENAESMVAASKQQQLQSFARHYYSLMPDIAAAKKFELALWLIARARALHGLWLCDIAERYPELLPKGYPDSYQQGSVVAWRRASEQAYLLMRRITLGRSIPEICFHMVGETISAQERTLAQVLLDHLEATC